MLGGCFALPFSDSQSAMDTENRMVKLATGMDLRRVNPLHSLRIREWAGDEWRSNLENPIGLDFGETSFPFDFLVGESPGQASGETD